VALLCVKDGAFQARGSLLRRGDTRYGVMNPLNRAATFLAANLIADGKRRLGLRL
jgi:hypothetical protein